MAVARDRRGEPGSRRDGSLFITKPVDALVGDTEEEGHQLARAIGCSISPRSASPRSSARASCSRPAASTAWSPPRPSSSSPTSASTPCRRPREETRKPARDLPIAIVGSLAIATLLYIAVAVVAVGALPFDQLSGQEAPLATALDEGAGFGWAADIISFGALVAISSVVLTILYGQTRIMFAMCRDGLMPRRFALPGPRHLDPVRGLARDRLRDLLLYGRRHPRLRRAAR
jgi:hypothetical protein